MFLIVAGGVLAFLTVAVLVAAGRSKNILAETDDGALAIYRDQLAELARDQAQGLITASDSESQKTEISRRMLQAARDVKTSAPQNQMALPWYFALLVPAVAGVMYWQIGAPHLPDVPRAERLASAVANNDQVAQLAMVEEHLDKNPDDAQGWQILLIEYQAAGRFQDAARALTQMMRLNGETGAGHADLAELLTMANKGLMTAESTSAAREALRREPRNPKAMFYGGLALKQEGKSKEALALFNALVASAAAETPWLPAVREEIAALQKAATVPTSAAPEIAVEQIEEGMGLAPEERQKMIAGMVDGLEKRLSENSNDLQGWLRLIRARAVLGERDKATASLKKAQDIFVADVSALAALSGLATEANLQ